MPRLHLTGFDDQERNLTFVKMNFQVLKLKFHACSFTHAFYPFHELYIAWPWQHKNTSHKLFFQYLVVKLACVNAASQIKFLTNGKKFLSVDHT